MQLEIVSTGMIQTIKISPWPCPLREPGVGVPTLLYMLHATDTTPLTEPRKCVTITHVSSLTSQWLILRVHINNTKQHELE